MFSFKNSYQHYTNRKPFKQEWLTDIPQDWDAKRLRFVANVNPTGTKIDLEDSADVSFIPMECVNEYGGLNLENTKALDEVGSGYTLFIEDDVVVAKITPCFENGKGSLAKGLRNKIALGTTELHVIRAGNAINNTFLFYLTISDLFRKTGESFMYGAGGQKRISDKFIKNFCAPLPSITEQQSIANFLDKKTKQIDDLIEQKEKLLQLLTEKRTAIITQAVTKGLNPKVKMKDSGIEWLGEVPEHWEVKKLKHLSDYIKTGITPSSNGPDYFADGTIDWYSPGDFDAKNIVLGSSSKKLDESAFLDTGQRKYPAQSVLIVGIGATLGKVGLAVNECSSNQQINAIYPSGRFDSKFLAYSLSTQTDIMKLVSNSTTLGIMNQEKTKNLLIATPPVDEQKSISKYLDSLIGSIGGVIQMTRDSIEKLKEYRSSLITSAVTGQIDVRKVSTADLND